MNRPGIALAMHPRRTEHVLPDRLLDRLESLGRLLDREPLQTFADERARRILPDTEILITGWGAPYVGRDALSLAGGLKIIYDLLLYRAFIEHQPAEERR